MCRPATTEALVPTGIGTESAAKFLGFKTLSMQGTEWNLTNSGSFSSSVDTCAKRHTACKRVAPPRPR